MKKTLIFPSYQDMHKLDYLHLIPKEIDIYIYEKKNEITEEDTLSYHKIDNILHYSIPLIGEQHFALVLHIINNYSNLDGLIHFSKTHWIPIFSTINIFLDELNYDNVMYTQHKTNLRKFISIFPDLQPMGHKHAAYYLLEQNNINTNLLSNNLDCFECNNNMKCFNCSLFCFHNNILFSTSHLKENSPAIKKLKEIFPDYNPKSEFNPCDLDASYIIHSSIILYHDMAVYKSIYNDLKNNFFDGHDSITTFFHHFFKETLNRIQI